MTEDALRDWINALPPFNDTEPRVGAFPGSHDQYLLEWGGNSAVLKLFLGDASSVRTGERSKDKAWAEAEAIRIFAPRGLAPGLIWEGSLPDETSGYAVIYEHVEGTNLCDNRTPGADATMDLCADALLAIHSEQAQIKVLSPNPRNLEIWWTRTHEAYRDLHTELLLHMPSSLSDALGLLMQSIAGDAQAHKRFWQGAALTPVHGSPVCPNFLLSGRQLRLVDWQRFGLGDPAYEVALASTQFGGEAPAHRISTTYLEKADDIMLARRVQIYQRLIPFSRVISLLSSAEVRSEAWSLDIMTNLRTCMETYRRLSPDMEAALNDTQAWSVGSET